MSGLDFLLQKVETGNRLRKEEGAEMLFWKALHFISTVPQKRIRQLRSESDVPYGKKCELGAVERPRYGYCMYHAALLARVLDYDRISVLEFGVAGGKGLLQIERHAAEIERELDVTFEIYGFDTGEGMPAPTDYRDNPYEWYEGDFEMDENELRSKLGRSTLVLGDVEETTRSFADEYDSAPIGAILNDIDFYSSTLNSFNVFDTTHGRVLPRVFIYFREIHGGNVQKARNRYTSQLGAINEFNERGETEKIARILCKPRLRYNEHVDPRRLYAYHRFDHPEYDTKIYERKEELFSLETTSDVPRLDVG